MEKEFMLSHPFRRKDEEDGARSCFAGNDDEGPCGGASCLAVIAREFKRIGVSLESQNGLREKARSPPG